MNPVAVAPRAPSQHVGNAERLPNLADILLTAIFHHARAADHLELTDLRQPGQEVVLQTVDEGSIFLLRAQIFEGQYRDAGRDRRSNKFVDVPSHDRGQRNQCRRQERAGRIASHPFSPTSQSPGGSRRNRFVLQPALEILRQRERGGIASGRLFCERLQTDGGKIAIDPAIPEPRRSGLGFEQ